MCGRVLADLGADVIKVEPPTGDPGRLVGPFLPDVGPPHESSLSWWSRNLGKRAVTLDTAHARGREILHRLVDRAAVVVDSPDLAVAAPAFSFDEFQRQWPAGIYVSVTGYGRSGPKSRYAATDLTVQAAGGHLYLNGDRDRPPVRIGLPVAELQAGVEAAAATVVALFHRLRTGRGQCVDVSMQQAIVWTLLNTTMTWQLVAREEERGGAVRKERASTIYSRLIWECRDGYVHFVPVAGGGGLARERSWRALVAWMEQEGFGDPMLRAKDWNGADLHAITQQEYDHLAQVVQRFLRTRTVGELHERAVRDKLLVAPVSTVREVLGSEQLAARRYYTTVVDQARGVRYQVPGAFAVMPATPVGPQGPPPTLGQHNDQVYGDELGLSAAELRDLTDEGVI
jgi:crotonobetainyl-CoA:carnitine CoA-transferase CaiB-like acyl-CoA transferase